MLIFWGIECAVLMTGKRRVGGADIEHQTDALSVLRITSSYISNFCSKSRNLRLFEVAECDIIIL